MVTTSSVTLFYARENFSCKLQSCSAENQQLFISFVLLVIATHVNPTLHYPHLFASTFICLLLPRSVPCTPEKMGLSQHCPLSDTFPSSLWSSRARGPAAPAGQRHARRDWHVPADGGDGEASSAPGSGGGEGTLLHLHQLSPACRGEATCPNHELWRQGDGEAESKGGGTC